MRSSPLKVLKCSAKNIFNCKTPAVSDLKCREMPRCPRVGLETLTEQFIKAMSIDYFVTMLYKDVHLHSFAACVVQKVASYN